MSAKLKRAFLCLAAAFCSQAALALNTGDIAFTGFNADGNDNLAFVALADIPAGTEIFFTDDEWNGQAIGSGGQFVDSAESEFKWTAPAGGVVAGTIVLLNDVSSASTISASVGTMTYVSSTNTGISNGSDTVFAYQGSAHVPTVFLASITNGTGPDAEIGNTGLTAGTTAVVLASSTDGGRYTGARSGQVTLAGYRALIGNTGTNWETTTGDGTAYVPFSSSKFFALSTQLIITEIQSNQATSGKNDFWELTNVGDTSVTLDGWKWVDNARSFTNNEIVTIPNGTTIAPGNSIVFTALDPTVFRAWWSTTPGTFQVVSTGAAPGLGSGDAVTLYNSAGTEVLYLSYAAGGFKRLDGSASTSAHAGASAGASTATQSLIWAPAYGTSVTGRRYTFADGTTLGTFSATGTGSNNGDKGSPGYSGFTSGSGPSATLTLSATPSSISESAANPAATGTVTRTGSTTAALTVNLSSSDTTEATVPATVTIPIGQTSATFNVTAVDDSFPDGSKTAIITASATDATAATFNVTVQDDSDVYLQTLMLTEIQSNQSATAGTGAEDYWELTNISSSPVSLAGYGWHDSGRSASAAAIAALPSGATIAPGESVIFTVATPANFRAWWGISSSVQVFQAPSSAPGLGQNDGIAFFDPTGNEIFYFSYAASGFTRADGNPSTGTHAGPSAGASAESQALIWDPTSGTTTPRYTFATGSNFSSFQAAVGTDLGSPGNRGVAVPTVSIAGGSVTEGNSGNVNLPFTVTRSDTTTAFTVGYAITGGTATSGTDYATLSSGTLTFAAGGAASQTINVSVNGDTTSEVDETVVITLSNVVNTTGATALGTAVGTGTIVNDDVIVPQITTHPTGTTIATGSTTTLTVGASGFPAPAYQWYVGASGDTSSPVSGATSASFVTPTLTANTTYWARATNTGGSADSDAATVTVTSGATSVNLANYVRVGRFDLPRPPQVALPAGTPAHNLLCEEASAVTYNWDTDTLFIACDGGKSITQVSKTGALIDTMTLALGSSPQGTDFYDIEGITYIGNGQFVISEERDRQLVRFTYVAGTTLSRSGAKTVKIGTFNDNQGTEGLSYDPQTSGYIVLKETQPIGIFQTNVDFDAGTATNGSPTTENSTNLFNPSLLGMTDVADVFALSNLPAMVGQPQAGNLIVLGQENARILNVDRSGNIISTINITTDPGDTLDAAGQQHEGITMDRAGNIYVVNENGGGSIEHPQLWVYAPATQPNQAPTAVVVSNAVTSITENSSTASRIKVGDIVVTDDGLGTNTLTVGGADASSFEIIGAALYIKAGVTLDYETKASFAISVNVDDTTLGATPDATVAYSLTVLDQVVETPPTPALVITEVASWGNSFGKTYGADWFEVTNVSENTVDITGWKVDDDSAAFGTALVLNGVTSIAPGESVIFIESANPTTTIAAFKTTWFGASPPANLQIGSYTGGGIGFGSGGDQVNLFNAAGFLQAKVIFGAADAAAPYATFDNTLALNAVTLTKFSAVGVNGGFVAADDVNEIGSPGYSAPGNLIVSEVAAWSSGNSPVGADWFEVTNIGARAVGITGWKMDDSSESPGAAVPLEGITSIAPGESVIFLESSTLSTTRTAFLSNWFGASPPAGLQVGAFNGSGAGLSTGGDAVNLYNTQNVRVANVAFAASTSSAPYKTFDNSAGLNPGIVTVLSAVNVKGAFVAKNSSSEIGSPGTIINAPGSFAAWLEANGYTSSGFDADTDLDGILDFAEYFFNQNPNSGFSTSATPHLVVNGSDLEFRFSYLTGLLGVDGFLEKSNDLLTWQSAILNTDYEIISQVENNGMTDVRFRVFTAAPPAPLGPFTYLTPDTAAVAGGSLKNLSVVNQGLVGSGRLSGELLDSFDETMGASSGLSITNWSYDSNTGVFSGTFNVLPDRGYNSGAIFSNYAARVHETPFTFTPYYGTTPAAPNQVVPAYASSTKFTYQDGVTTKFTTGLNPTGTSTVMGQTVGTVTAANGPGGDQVPLMSFDAEAIHVFPDGTGFVSDEYGTYIARFDATKKITKLIQLPGAAQPFRPAGTPNFDSVAAPTTGRRNNQGLEGMAVSPDSTRLFAMLQSALVQDTNGAQQQTRYNTRVYVYDIAGSRLEDPLLIGEYVVQLPRFDANGNNSGLDATAAQSELVALSNTQFLMLPRDGNGLGKGTTDPIVTKTVNLVDLDGATNILGLYDAEGNQISPTGVLRPEITPAANIVVVNLISSTDLAKFGLNSNTTNPTQFTINEKIEGMSIVPDLSTERADDFFLFVANDNDFQSSDVKMLDATGAVVSYGDGRFVHPNAGRITNDATFYVYRLVISPNDRKFFRLTIEPTP